MKKDANTFSPKEIGVALNNAIQASLHPRGLEIPENRLRKLREYAMALVEPLAEHLEEQVYEEDGVAYPAPLKAEEAVVILLSAALVIHMTRVLGTEKLPQAKVAEILFKQ